MTGSSSDSSSDSVAAFGFAPTVDDITHLARMALESLPRDIAAAVGDLSIRVEDFPTPEIELEMGLESPFDLLGLYQGVDLLRRSVSDPPAMPDTVLLFRRPILDYWCEGEDTLADIVRHVLIHEIGHHMGYSDDDMERLEDEA